ncbi:MAG: phenylalanine--tRNA ligase subunit beta [Clostridiales bacterium]|nr:phenylalanine--tRNA ligase subunit beta [Clostridiales bacterium]
MKASLEWLQEYSDIDVNCLELGDILTMTGSKVEEVIQKGNDIKNVVVGKILEIEKHPDADKLVITKVDVGNNILQIVTGANNIKVNDIIPVAKDGAELPNGVKIKTGKLRGIESCGMMCSVGELNLSISDYPEQIEDGIMILGKKYEKDLGKDIVEVLDLKEEIIDFEITPNRPDCLSIEGLGRETAASLDKPFKNPRKNIDELQIPNKKEIEGLTVDITAPELCYRYIARVVKNVKVGPSPDWMKKRLKACGIRSINNIVDITNYVMLEMGQPMHAFDINSISGKHITVRRAKNGEKITTLDETERVLDENDLVIADDKKAVAIAGVMGGLNSEIEKDTQTVVFESAMFYGGNIRKTAKKVGLRTESSARYEKGLSSENTLRAINRAVELVELLGAGEVVEGKIDVYPTKQKINKIKLDVDKINTLLGTNISKQEMINILEKLDIKVENDMAIAPYFRMDLEFVADIAEEIARFYGYDKLETTLVRAGTTIGVRTKEQKIENKIQEILVTNGLSEIYTYGFLSEKDLEKSKIKKELIDNAITIINPLGDEFKLMRPTTIPSMMQILAGNNNKKNQNVKLFDISRNYKNIDNQVEKGEVPLQENILTIGTYGEDVDFYTLKGLVENILEAANVNRYDIERETTNESYHPGRCANLKVGIDTIATFGEVHPEVLMNYEINKRVYLAEINITKIVKYSKANKKYTEVPKFPAAERDIAVIVDEDVQVGDIEKAITKKCKRLLKGQKGLEELKLFDIYRDEKIGENKKSVAYSLIFRDKTKSLSDDEINPVMEEITKELEEKFKAELRK